MRKASWLAGASINGNADVDDVLDATEKIAEVSVRHFKRHVANEEGSGRRVLCYIRAIAALVVRRVRRAGGILDSDPTAFKQLHVEVFEGGVCRFLSREIDVGKAEQ